MMNVSKRKFGFYYAVSAAAAAAAAGPIRSAVAQTCACKLPATMYKTQYPLFQLLATASYMTDIAVDSLYGFRSSVVPGVWFDWDGISGTGNTLTAQVCHLGWTGLNVSCGTQTSQATNDFSASHHYEIGVPVNSIYSAANNVWDRYRLIVGPGSMSIVDLNKSATVPVQAALCW